MKQGLVIMVPVDPKTGEVQSECRTIVMKSGNPIRLAEQQTYKFANGMKDWGKTRKAFGQEILDKGLTLKMIPVIVEVA